MNLLDIERQQREPRIVDIQHGTSWAMFERVARFEIFPIQARGFAISAFANDLIGGQDGVNWGVSLIGVVDAKSMFRSVIESGGCKDAARLAGNRLVDHLAINRADALGVLGEDRSSLLDFFGSWGERFIDRADLRRVNGGLGAEAKCHGGGGLLLQTALIVDVEK